MANEIKKADLLRVMDIDMAAQFGGSVSGLLQLLGISDVQTVAAGTQLKQYKAEVSGGLKKQAAEGDDVPLTNVKQTLVDTFVIEPELYAKATSIQAIQKAGYETAVSDTDKALMRAIRAAIRQKFFDMLGKGTGTASAKDLASAIAQGVATLENELSQNSDEAEEVIAFINPLDKGEYLGNAAVANQGMAFGMNFYSDVLGVSKVFTDSRVTKGTAFVTAAENIHAYAPDNGALAAAGFDYVPDETGVVSVHHEANYGKGTAMTYVNSGLLLVPEVKNYIVKVTISAGK